MSIELIQQRIKTLEDMVRYHRDRYYNEVPEISDQAFDALEQELRDLDPENETLAEVGAPEKAAGPDLWPKIKHTMFMGSLHKAMDMGEMRKWVATKNAGILQGSEKMDGFSLALRYEKGVLKQAVTRGDGETGSDVTPNMKYLQDGRYLNTAVPTFTGWLRAEGMILNSVFERVFKPIKKSDGSPRYTNPRNTASGLIRAQDSEDVKLLAYMTLFFYDIDANKEFDHESAKLDFISTYLGFPVPKYWPHLNLTQVDTIYQDYITVTRDSLDYEIDGLVFKIEDCSESAALGITDRRPNGQVALKFPGKCVATRVTDIIWELGDSGRFTPVAILTPTWNGRVTLRNANCHNLDYLREKKITVGCLAEVYQAGDIIPQIKLVVETGNGEINMPTSCPCCNTKTEMQDAYLVCPNLSCSNKMLGRIHYYVKAVGLKHFGEAAIEGLFAQGILKDPSDIYLLTATDFKKVERKGEKHFKKFLHYREETCEMDLASLLGSVLDSARERTMEKVISYGFDTLEKLFAATGDQFAVIPNIKDKGYQIEAQLKLMRPVIERLLERGVKLKVRKDGVLTGKSFLFTGVVEVTNPATGKRFKREELEEMVKDNGGVVASSVSRNLSYLVQADPNSSSSKSKKAKELGVNCVSDGAFLQMVGL